MSQIVKDMIRQKNIQLMLISGLIIIAIIIYLIICELE